MKEDDEDRDEARVRILLSRERAVEQCHKVVLIIIL